MMFAVPEDVSAYQKAQLDSVLKFADATTTAFEQWFDLNIKSAKAGSAEVLKQLRALAAAKDVQELSSLQTGFSQANSEKVMGYVRAVQAWATDSYGEITKVVEAEVAEINKNLASALDKAAKSAPSGSEYAFAAMKQAMSAANQAYDVIAKAGKQAVDMTDATIANTSGAIAGKKKAA
jgi:phasin family protein